MIAECSTCESKVEAEILGSNEELSEEDLEPFRFSLVKCKVCGSTLLVVQDLYQTDANSWEWSVPKRLWPDADDFLHWSIPGEVRSSLVEARKCFKAKAYSACAVMCGRAIEAICLEHTKAKTLAKGLRALRESGTIDGRLFEWGESLRYERNLGAHASGTKTSREDARDVLDFAIAICEYVFVLSEKHEEYKARKEKTGGQRPKVAENGT